MPARPPRTKAEKQAAMHTVMSEYKDGDLRSGSKQGPKVKSRQQAIAIGLSESGQSKPAREMASMEREAKAQGPLAKNAMPPAFPPAPPRGGGESKPGYDRSGHFPGNPGFAEGRHKPNQTYAEEQTEHWGDKAGGSVMGSGAVKANVGSESRGTKLVGVGDVGHKGQPGGHDIGTAPGMPKTGDMGGEPYKFAGQNTATSCGYGHGVHQRRGALRVSGHSGAHQIGRRK